MEKLDLSNLESIIKNLEISEQNTKNILEKQSETLFHTRDYYEGQLDVYDDVVTMLKMHLEIAGRKANQEVMIPAAE